MKLILERYHDILFFVDEESFQACLQCLTVDKFHDRIIRLNSGVNAFNFSVMYGVQSITQEPHIGDRPHKRWYLDPRERRTAQLGHI